jgi:hypothetical protein
MNKKISILLKVLKDLDLEKFATPLADVYDFGTETGKYRYKTELTGKKSKDYFKYSKKIKDDFAVYYMPSSVLNLLDSSKYYLFDTPEDIGNGIKDEVGNAHWWNHENNVNNVVSYLKNSKKYKYNIIVNSSKEYGDSYNPTWFIHDVIGHTFSILSKEIYGENQTIIESIFGRENLSFSNLFLLNNEQSFMILSKIFSEMDVNFDRDMFNKVFYKEDLLKVFFERNINYMSTELKLMIFKLHDRIASVNINDFLKKIDAEIHSKYILDSGGEFDNLAISDILPSIIVSYISDKSNTINILKEYLTNKNSPFSSNEFYNQILKEFSEKNTSNYISINNDYIHKLLEVIGENLPYSFSVNKFSNLFKQELVEHFMDIIHGEEFKKEIFNSFNNKNNIEKTMKPILDRFERVDMALERVSDKYIICNMTNF